MHETLKLYLKDNGSECNLILKCVYFISQYSIVSWN